LYNYNEGFANIIGTGAIDIGYGSNHLFYCNYNNGWNAGPDPKNNLRFSLKDDNSLEPIEDLTPGSCYLLDGNKTTNKKTYSYANGTFRIGNSIMSGIYFLSKFVMDPITTLPATTTQAATTTTQPFTTTTQAATTTTQPFTTTTQAATTTTQPFTTTFYNYHTSCYYHNTAFYNYHTSCYYHNTAFYNYTL